MGQTISVIIPIYNVEHYLRQCLDSIVDQTYRDLEIILVDDGSPDDCGMICDEYAEKDDRVVVIHKKNEGVSSARNIGIHTATSQWITFVDPDDWCERDMFERMATSLPGMGTDVLCARGLFVEYASGSSKECICFDHAFQGNTDEMRKMHILYILSGYMKKGGSNGVVAVPWNRLYRTAFLRETGIVFDTRLHPLEDILFILEVFNKASGFAVCDALGYHYRSEIPTSSVNRYNSGWPEMLHIFSDEMAKLSESWSPIEEYEAAINRTALKAIRLSFRCYYFNPAHHVAYGELAKEIKELKSISLIKIMIYSSLSDYLSWKQIVLKSLLRLPSPLPLRIYYWGKQRLRKPTG